MNKRLMLIVFSLFAFFGVDYASAYLDCTPAACDSGYIDNGVVCEGGECVRQCLLVQCDLNWTVVQNSDFGWVNEPGAVAKDSASASYTPTNTSLCYQFQYDGPFPAGSPWIQFGGSTVTPDCDLEGVGGFKTNSNDWFDNMRFHLGNPQGNTYDQLVKSVRGHHESTANSQYQAEMGNKTDAREDTYIYCAPSQVICDATFAGPSGGVCQADCFGNPTWGWVRQGYYVDQGNDNTTMYTNSLCTSATINSNAMQNATFLVYTSETMNVPLNGTADKKCDRTNEPPIVYDIVTSPTTPNAGQDLECAFNYTDAENFQEQGSTFEWYKNGANQNIDASILDKGNLSVNDAWFCKMTPSDGLTSGNQSVSTNNITVQTTIKDPSIAVEQTSIWTQGGFYGATEEIFDFNSALQSALDACAPNQEGLCTLTLTFSSSAAGTMDLSNMQIFYTQPTIVVQNLTALEISGLSVVIGFDIYNALGLGAMKIVNWTLDMGDNNIIENNQEIMLWSPETVFVFAQHNYSQNGTYVVSATAFNETYQDTKSINVTV